MCVYLFQKDEAGRRVFLTQGSWDVTEIVSVDSNYVYFLGTGGNATKRHLYRFVMISLVNSRYKMQKCMISQYSYRFKNSMCHRALLSRYDQHPECMTCHYDNDVCDYVRITFSDSSRYYVQACLGPDIPHHTLRSTLDDRGKTPHRYDKARLHLNIWTVQINYMFMNHARTRRETVWNYINNVIFWLAIILEDNIELRSRLQNKALPTKEYITITADDGHSKYQEFTFVKIVSLPVYNVYNMRERTVLFPRPAKQRHSWKLFFFQPF